MKNALSIFVGLAAVLCPGSAGAQLFNDGQPAGVWSVAVGPAKEGSWSPTIYGCAGGPHMMMAVAAEGGNVGAIGPGYFVDAPWVYHVAGKADFQQAAGGLSLGEIRALEASRDLSILYAGFQAYGDVGGQGGSPLFSLTLEGNVQVAVPVEEMNEATGAPASIMAIASGSGTVLWVIAQEVGLPKRHLLSIDLSKPAGSRVESVLDSEKLVKMLAVPPGTVVLSVYEMGNNLAADDSGRVFFDAGVDIANAETTSVVSRILLRRDADGKIVEMTGFEYSPINSDNSWGYFNYPALGIWNGLEYDPDSGMLVGAGHGLWLIDPDVPGSSFPIMQPETVQGVGQYVSGDNWVNSPHGAGGGATCLARLEDGWFGTMMYAYFLFGYDLGLLDYDNDGLTGAEEKKRGTNPLVRDTDGGGIADGLEVTDYTDPNVFSDDRWFEQPPAEWTMSPLYWGSALQASPGGGSLGMHTVAAADGALLFAGADGQDVERDLYRFDGWDAPGMPTGQSGFNSYMASDAKGNVYGLDYKLKPGTYPVVRVAPDGTKKEVFSKAAVVNLVGSEPVPTSWTVCPGAGVGGVPGGQDPPLRPG